MATCPLDDSRKCAQSFGPRCYHYQCSSFHGLIDDLERFVVYHYEPGEQADQELDAGMLVLKQIVESSAWEIDAGFNTTVQRIIARHFNHRDGQLSLPLTIPSALSQWKLI